MAVALVACGSPAAPDETAPPPTPLPSLRTPTDSLGPTDSPDAALRPSPDAEAAYQQLLASVPESLLGRCARSRPAGGALARVECTPATGADAVSYALFDAEDAMLAAYRARLDAIPAVDREGPGCGQGPGTKRLDSGRKACFRDGGAATVLWTNDLVYVLASARRADQDWAALETFWQDAGPITP